MANLARLRLGDFRVYESLRLDLAPGINLLVGDNGAGKTTILEAIHFLCLLRSFRTRQTQQLKRWEQSEFVVSGQLAGQKETKMGVRLAERRELRLNGEAVSRASEFICQYHCVPFLPSDQELIRGPGGGRRRFLDVQLCQLRPSYLQALSIYGQAMKQRNVLLRSSQPDVRLFAAYEKQMAREAAEILAARRAYVAELQGYLSARAEQILGNEATRAVYRGCKADSEDALRRALADGRSRDMVRGFTQTGLHRDDIIMTRGGRSLANFGSEGQCRGTAVALRMAATDCLLAQRQEQIPVVLLIDDVTGDLDGTRKALFLDLLSEVDQAVVAATDCALVEQLRPRVVMRVSNGTVSTIDG